MKWFEIKAANTGAGAQSVYTISLMDNIGFWGITAQDFIRELHTIPEGAAVRLEVNSDGGSVIDGIAISNALRARGGVTAVVLGAACSAATLVLMGCERIEMPANTYLMVHDVAGAVWGSSDEMRDYADVMDKMTQTIVNMYMSRSGQSEEVVRGWLEKDTWLNASEAKEFGLCDEVTQAFALVAHVSESMSARMSHAPESVRALFQNAAPVQTAMAAEIPTEPAVPVATPAVTGGAGDGAGDAVLSAVKLCLSAGESVLAQLVADAQIAPNDAQMRIERAQGIRALAQVAHYPSDRVDELITNNSSIDSARVVMQAHQKTQVPAVNGAVSVDRDFVVPKLSAGGGRKRIEADYKRAYANLNGANRN